jgi:DNA-binding GntR family transcriptional regulator
MVRKAAPKAPASTLPLSEVAHRSLMAMLLSGELAPNEVITERQLAEQLKVSRTPLREAIRLLEGAGLLKRQRTGALVVHALNVEEFIHILHVRRILEGEAARLAAGHVPAADLDRMKRRAAELLALPDEAPAPEANDHEDLHTVITQAAGNPVLQETIASLRLRTSMFRLGRLPARRADVVREHLDVVEALAKGDSEAARMAMEHHIDQVRLALLARFGRR